VLSSCEIAIGPVAEEEVDSFDAGVSDVGRVKREREEDKRNRKVSQTVLSR
jgi:hypothetical protein